MILVKVGPLPGEDHCERFESGRTSGIGDREVVGAVSKSSKIEVSDDLCSSERGHRTLDDGCCINQGDRSI